MKRNMNLIRLLLLDTEGDIPKSDLSTYSEEQIDYHQVLLIEAALVHGEVLIDSAGNIGNVSISRLTWAGHEFLDAARNEGIWNKAVERVKKSGVSVTLAIMEDLLKKLLKEPLGL